MKRRHLVLITLHADPTTPSGVFEGGGTHSYIRELIAAIPKNNWNLTVLTRWADSRLPEYEIVSPEVKVIRLRISKVGLMNKRFLNGLHSCSLEAARTALASEPKVDLFHSVYWNSGRVARDLSRELGLSFVHTVISNGRRRLLQGAEDQSPDRLKIEKMVFASAFAIFCVSGQERADLIEYYKVPPDKIVIVGRPVASCFRRPSHDERGNPFRPHLSETDL